MPDFYQEINPHPGVSEIMVTVPIILQDVDLFLDRSQALMELLMLAIPGLAN